jgi:hypothetical protein
MQLAGEHLLLSLFAFNLGIELGQLVFIGVAIPLLYLLTQKLRLDTRLTGIVVSAFVAHAAWHWMSERWEALARQPWPEVDVFQAALWLALAAALVVLGRMAVLRGRDTETGVKSH